MKSLLRFFFRLLYHEFAFSYDLVAAAVSMNRWKEWVASVLPLVQGQKILEIGHGPGHLQRLLLTTPTVAGPRLVVGLDRSPQMGRLASRNLKRRRPSVPPNLTRGRAQELPFAEAAFDTIVATFPTEYITEPRTLAEARRCLKDGGRLVALPVAWPRNRLLDWLFRVTSQAPAEALEQISLRLRQPFIEAGFQSEVRTLEVESGILLIVVAKR